MHYKKVISKASLTGDPKKDVDLLTSHMSMQNPVEIERTKALIILLSEIDDKIAREALEKLIQSSDLYIRYYSLSALANRPDVLLAKETIISALHQSHYLIATKACSIVSNLNMQESYDTLRQLLDSDSYKIQASALIAMSHLKPSETRKEIYKFLSSPQTELKSAALNALGNAMNLEDYGLIYKIYTNEENSSIQLIAAQNLLKLADKTNWVSLFTSFLNKNNKEINNLSISLAYRFTNKEFLLFLIQFLIRYSCGNG